MPDPSDLVPPTARSAAGRYAAAGCVALALASRAALTPVLGDQTPFVTVFLAVLAAAEAGGFRAAVITAVAGGLLAWLLFVPGREPLPLVMFGIAIFGTCLFVRTTEVARGRAEAATADARGRQARLEHEVAERRAAEDTLARHETEAGRRRRVYEAALSSTPDFVYVFSLDYKVLYANDALIRMWGRGTAGAIGKTFLEIGYEPWHAEMHAREIDQVAATRRPIRGEVPFTGTNGRRIYDYIFVPVFGAAGEVEAVAGTTRDVTDRKAAEDALKDEGRRKDEFLAMLGHELRNPLAPIRTGIAILGNPRADAATVARVRGMMGRQVEHLVRLVDDLLDMARIMRGKIDLRRERIDLTAVVGRAVETARPGIDARGHHLTVELPPDPVWVDGDEVRLTQVVANLLANAAKYTDPGGRIWLIVSTTHEGGRGKAEGGQDNSVPPSAFPLPPSQVEVRVRDTGVGLPADMLGRVFDLFVQVDKAAARSDGGLGIGLTLVKQLVEQHGGTVSAASDGPGKGSDFVVRLPTATAFSQEGGRGKAEGGPEPSSPPSAFPLPPSSRRVLVVDDNVDAAVTLTAVLELHGHQVWTAHDGPAALGLAANGCRPDAVVLDIGLPGMDGYEVARQLRAGPASGAVLIALTGYGQDGDRQRAAAAGFDHHFTKPVDLDHLVRVLAGP